MAPIHLLEYVMRTQTKHLSNIVCVNVNVQLQISGPINRKGIPTADRSCMRKKFH